jgi:hypothetical protein
LCSLEWFRASTSVWTRSSQFKDITQHKLVVIDVSIQHIGLIFNGQAYPLTWFPKTSVTNTLTCLTCQKNRVVLNMRNFVPGKMLPSSSGSRYCTVWHMSQSLRYVQNASPWYENTPFWKLGIFHSKEVVMLYAFFWVIPRRLNFTCRRFGTLCSLFIVW